MHVATADGARIACKRKPADGPPVVFVHGIAVNADLWDLPHIRASDPVDFETLPGQLHALGYDVWLVNLRGHGAPHMHSKPPQGLRDWTFDHYVAFDLPAVVDEITERNGRRPWLIGNSMGAMTVAGYLQGAAITGQGPAAHVVGNGDLAACRQDRVRGAVLIEFPAALRWPASLYDASGNLRWGELWSGGPSDASANFPFELLAHARFLETGLYVMGEIPLRWLRTSQQAGSWRDSFPAPLADALGWADDAVVEAARVVVNGFKGGENFEPLLFTRGFLPSLDHIKHGVLTQFGKSVRERSLVSGLGSPAYDYTHGYPRIHCPLLLVSGGRDKIANAQVTREVFYDRIASADRTHLHYPEIAHGEFEWAEIACRQVYPQIIDWLQHRRP